LLPLNIILSYLWLTSLIFTSQDWAGGRCRYNTFNMGLGTHCGLKHTAMAFFIIGLYVYVPLYNDSTLVLTIFVVQPSF
jgi:hypothetical protein